MHSEPTRSDRVHQSVHIRQQTLVKQTGSEADVWEAGDGRAAAGRGAFQLSGQDCQDATAVKRFRNKPKINKQTFQNDTQGFREVFLNPPADRCVMIEPPFENRLPLI